MELSVKSAMQYSSELSANFGGNPLKKDSTSAQDRNEAIKEAASKVDAKSLTMQYTMQFSLNISIESNSNLSAQSGLFGASAMDNPAKLNDIINGLDLKSIGYEGKALTELSPKEAADLIAEDGFFGIAKTSERIADFVINGAGSDLERLKAGREGIVRGFEQATKAWGDELPEISQTTYQKALEKVDAQIAKLGGAALETDA